MRKIPFCLMLLILTRLLLCQSYLPEIGKIWFFPNKQDGTDITQELADMILACNQNDVIVLPPGKFIISDKIQIYSKVISIIGHGVDSLNGTMLYKDESITNDFKSFFEFNEQELSSNPAFVTGIYFKSVPSSRYSGGKSVSFADKCLEFIKYNNFIVTDNRIQYFGLAGVEVKHRDSIDRFNGLIFRNEFIELYRPELGDLGYGVLVAAHSDYNNRWITNPEFGSIKFLFIEDNYFRETRHAVAGGSNAKYVFRNNDVVDNWVAPGIDMHGAGNYGNKFSSRASEIYGNSIVCNYDYYGNPLTASTPWWYYISAVGIRGGESLIFNNSCQNCRTFAKFHLEEKNPLSYPSPYQIGYISGLKYGYSDSINIGDHGDGDVFAWDNRSDLKFPDWSIYSIENPLYLKYSRDIHVDVKKYGYNSYAYPHDYRNYYYSFVNTFLKDISIKKIKNIDKNSVEITWSNVLCEDGYYVYNSLDGINFSIIDTTYINDTTTVISQLSPSVYWLYVVAFNDSHIGQKSQTKIVNQGLLSDLYQNPIVVYPNPSNGIFNVLMLQENLQIEKIEISDLEGNIIYQRKYDQIHSETIKVDLTMHQKGLYLLTIEINDFIFDEIITIQ